MQKNRALVLAEIETTYGTDPAPDVTTNAILCETPEFEIGQKALDRKYTRSYMGTLPKVTVGESLKIKLKAELKGGGAAGTAPEIAPLLKACNLTESINAGTNVRYTPHSDLDGDSATIYFYQHDLLHKISGCRGDLTIDAKAGEYGIIEFDMTGIYQSVVDSLLTSALASGVSYNSTMPARFLSANFSLNGSTSLIIENIKLKLGNKIGRRADANASTGILEYFITDREATAEIDPEAMRVASFDTWGLWAQSSRVSMGVTIGGAAGNTCTITSPKAQIKDLKYGERETLLTHQLTIDLTPDDGNDEIDINFT